MVPLPPTCTSSWIRSPIPRYKYPTLHALRFATERTVRRADRIAPTQGCALGDNCNTHTFTSSLSQAHHAFVQGDKPARDIDAVCSNMLRGNAGGRCCDACRPRAAPIFGPPSPMATGETRDRACARGRGPQADGCAQSVATATANHDAARVWNHAVAGLEGARGHAIENSNSEDTCARDSEP